ncbi:MAG: penicillin-binding protein 2, partial [Gemmatimonadetes bacterium]|nr:penicillin-binding protein 2 [Gemmatimonadota bacterium]NIR81149.1 penicillin-binding protein 2 [Gemmatimonadota bacterium]NIT89981.1 penicillin-binding protein 2 [Gemmatimonadota bacterium]NIU33790.1 penicillin-binding protein 2 [Gemmatimonadota bacterium]NIU38012.1 penicillin-binding protein 2 [Gemmatimonadota bacterium]
MRTIHPLARRRRARIALAVVVVTIGFLLAAFFRLQVLRSSTWMLQSESNRLRPLPVQGARGTIYDRDGRIVADNVPAYSISILPAPLDSMRATLGRVHRHLDLSPGETARLRERLRTSPREPLVVTAD